MTEGRPRPMRDVPATHWYSRVPSQALSRVATRYVGYREESLGTVTRRELPNGSVTLIVSFGPAMTVAVPESESPCRVTSFVAGVSSIPALTRQDGPQRGLQIDLTPLGAFSLFGFSMSELTNSVFSLDDLIGADAERLSDRLAGEPDWGDRFEVLDQALLAAISRGPVPSAEVAWLWGEIVARRGNVRMNELGAELGWSRGRLVEQCRRELGMPPKALARIIRFDEARRRLAAGGAGVSIGRVAAETGYFDQAHLHRDVRELAGCTPAELVRAEVMAT